MEFANRTGVTVISNYIDRALYAKTNNRPEFQKMIKDGYKHCFNMIIVWKLDRFGRNSIEVAINKQRLKKHNKVLISAAQRTADNLDVSKT